jgi:hypothetical protein
MDQGKKIWFFPDGDRPPYGNSEMKGHESIVIMNPNNKDAHIKITFFYEDKEPARDIEIQVDAERVRCLRTDNVDDFGEHTIPVSMQYAIKLVSDIPIIAQYGKLDPRQPNLSYYTTSGYSCD